MRNKEGFFLRELSVTNRSICHLSMNGGEERVQGELSGGSMTSGKTRRKQAAGSILQHRKKLRVIQS